jgi:hypothetical protein
VLLTDAIDCGDLSALLARYGIGVTFIAADAAIPGSFWGDSEAGLVGSQLYLRADTPLHSALHEGAHYVCMTPERRAGLHTDAGGDTDEENAVCYLQIEWAAVLPNVGRQKICLDMDSWGYSFRLGSAAAWFEQDAADARRWLLDHGVLGVQGELTYACR